MTSTAQPARGTYLLLAQLDEPVELAIGQLGTFAFPAGWYAYAGSALGPGGLPARLARHARLDKRLHWHIDYLLHKAVLEASWQIASPARIECAWASAISQLPGARIAVPRFGASDCRCRGHLVYLADRPGESAILHALCEASRGAGCCRISRRVYANCTVR
jgi:Uri superfamily endonuclease